MNVWSAGNAIQYALFHNHFLADREG